VSPKIGFVLLAHDKAAQLRRLTQRLDELYPGAPIACHHDFSKTPLDGITFPEQVRFVQPHIVTGWGQISVALAFREALRLLYSNQDAPDWFVYLSGSDYPVRAPGDVLRDLESGGADAYIDHRQVVHPFVPDQNVRYAESSFCSKEWVPLAYGRYVAIPLWVPGFSLARRKRTKIYLGQLRSERVVRWLTPFDGNLRCYGGEAWFTANRRAAKVLLADSETNRKLHKHFARKFIPDEALYHTILCNQPGLRVAPMNYRYIDWSGGTHHPKLLGMEDLPRIFESGAHFARKFDLDSGQQVFDAIDEAVNRAVAGARVG